MLKKARKRSIEKHRERKIMYAHRLYSNTTFVFSTKTSFVFSLKIELFFSYMVFFCLYQKDPERDVEITICSSSAENHDTNSVWRCSCSQNTRGGSPVFHRKRNRPPKCRYPPIPGKGQRTPRSSIVARKFFRRKRSPHRRVRTIQMSPRRRSSGCTRDACTPASCGFRR